MRDLNDTPAGLQAGTTLIELHGNEQPGFTPGPGPDGTPKPYFREGDPVFYHVALGVHGTGRIRGLASQNVIDMWLVERDLIADASVYPWSTIVVPHTSLKRLTSNRPGPDR